MEDQPRLRVRLYGSFTANWSDGRRVRIGSAKQRALIAMLATAADGVHTRAWLQEALWGRSGPELGRASLRRALSNLRQLFGAEFDTLFDVSNIDVRLRSRYVAVVGDRRDGAFLEGISIPEDGFEAWLRDKRQVSEGRTLQLPSVVTGKVAPSMAIVPFIARSNTPAELHFSDMIALEITRALSRSTMIDVISHLSSRRFQQRSLDLNTIRSTLDIDYLVYGTVRVDGGTFHIDADFANARTGRIHWTLPFSGKVSDLLRGERGAVEEIASRIGQSILSASIELARSRPLPDVEDHALFMSAIALMHQHTLAGFSRSRAQLEELIRRAPDHSLLHAWLGKWYILSIAQGWSTDVAGDKQTAADCTARALDINPSCSFSLAIDGMIQNDKTRDFSIASARFRDALQINPNNAFAWLLNARLHAFVGNGADAVKCADRACSLSPLDPHRYFFDNLAATAHVANGDYAKGLKLAERSLAANNRHASGHRVRVVTLELLGRRDEAQTAAKQLLRLEPGLTVKSYLDSHSAADFPNGRIWADALQRAGVPAR